MNGLIYSQFIRVMNIGWEDMLWYSFWFIIFIGIHDIVFGGCILVWSRKLFIKNELPQLHNNLVGKLTAENNRLHAENESLTHTKENLYAKLKLAEMTIDNLAKANSKSIEKALEEIRNVDGE